MNENILKAIDRPEVDLGIISIIIDDKGLGNEGLSFLCSQKLSHVTSLYLGKTIDIKLKTK
jgi:hypothetical protein